MGAPEVDRFTAPDTWRAIDFLSDLHLDAAHPRTFEAWRAALLQTSADAVVLLGDIFEVWVGDDARHSGFEAQCTQVLKQAATQRFVAFMAGNRDFLVGPELLRETGVRALADPTLFTAFGRSVLLTHGDALCLADADYQRFRAMVRDPAWQQSFLARPLAERQAIARQMREASQANQAGQSPQDWADIDAGEAVRWLQAAGCHEMVHGHTHRPGTSELAPGYARHVLSDWDLDAARPRAEVLRWSPAGLQRLAAAAGLG